MANRKDNSGALFKNDRKTQPNHPDYSGNCTVNGIEYYMDAWIKNKDNPDKKTYMSFSFKPKNQQQGSGQSSGGGDDGGFF